MWLLNKLGLLIKLGKMLCCVSAFISPEAAPWPFPTEGFITSFCILGWMSVWFQPFVRTIRKSPSLTIFCACFSQAQNERQIFFICPLLLQPVYVFWMFLLSFDYLVGEIQQQIPASLFKCHELTNRHQYSTRIQKSWVQFTRHVVLFCWKEVRVWLSVFSNL